MKRKGEAMGIGSIHTNNYQSILQMLRQLNKTSTKDPFGIFRSGIQNNWAGFLKSLIHFNG